jgi:hypothetical protein
LNADWSQPETKCGQSDRRCAHEQLAPDSLLHLLDGFTERWLFDSALLRGAREAQFVTNCKEVADVLRFHDQHSKIFGVEMTPRKCKVETVYQIEILDANRPEMKEPTTEAALAHRFVAVE